MLFMIDQKTLESNIIAELGLGSLSDEQKVALLNKMSDVIQKRLTLRVLDEMSEGDKKEFEKILEAEAGSTQTADFLQKVFPDFLQMVQEEIERLKKELITQFK